MIEIVRFEAEHILKIGQLQPGQIHWMPVFSTPGYVQMLEQTGLAYSALADNRVIGCAGLIDGGLGSGILWAVAHQEAGRHMVALIRAVRRLMSLAPLRRLEATCERGFRPGCRALELLGFQCEGLMKKYGPDGHDHFRYARIT